MKLTVSALLLLLLAGCALTEQVIEKPVIIVSPPKVEAAETMLSPVPEEYPYSVLYEMTNFTSGRYEPAVGCYLGASLAADENGMRPFERRTGKKHAVYAVEVKLDEEYPETWMLQCIAAQGTPLILLRQGEEGFSTQSIKEAAEWLGAYHIPMFVAYEPFTDKNAEVFKRQYRFTRAVFMELASMAAFVWLTDMSADWGVYYPGDDAADWVGLRMMTIWEGDYDAALGERFDSFYMRYQGDKPIMLAPMGISHFSESDYSYRLQEAGDALNQLYNRIQYEYPRVKLVVYTDRKEAGEDFSVSNDTHMLPIYMEITANQYFLSTINGGRKLNPWRRSELKGYYIDGQAYISADLSVLETHMINGIPYMTTDALKDRFAVIDHERKVINVYQNVKP